MPEFSIITASILFVVACAVTFVGASTGGSAMFVVPLCVFLGFPVNVVVGTTRFSALFSMLGAFCGFSKHKKIDYKIGLSGSVAACIGAYFGANILLLISDDLAKKIIGTTMLFLLFMSFFKKKCSKDDDPPTAWRKAIGYCTFFVIGSIGGAFGGQGILLVYALRLFFGMDVSMAAGTRVVMSFFITAVSFIVYFNAGVIHWYYGIVLAVASLLGTYFGAIYCIKKGEGFMERILEMIVLLASFKLLWP